MPHAENGSMNSHAVNGERPSSQFLEHLTSYPVVSDSISTFKSNPYGKKSIILADQGYKSFIAPFLPYAQLPYDFVKPYVAKADSLAEGGLTKVEHTFPIVKEDTQKIKSSVLELALFPFRAAGTSKDYVYNTYSGEYQKCGGDGLISGGKALITTSLVVTSDTFSFLSSLWGQKKQQTKEIAKEHSGN